MGDAYKVPEAVVRPAVILVVEDEALVRFVAAEALRGEGFTVIEAANVAEAAMVLAAGIAVDLVFTDVRMPGPMDGLEFARSIRTERPDLPILVTSGHLDAVSADWASGFLIKPYLPGDAVALILSLVGKEMIG